jgi:hypothetical protein
VVQVIVSARPLQSGAACAKKRFENYKKQPIRYKLPKDFKGTLASYGLTGNRRTPTGIKAAIIREKGVNGDREMAYSLYLAGFDVKDVHMTDLMSGRETLDDALNKAMSAAKNAPTDAKDDALKAQEETLSKSLETIKSVYIAMGNHATKIVTLSPVMSGEIIRGVIDIVGKSASGFKEAQAKS